MLQLWITGVDYHTQPKSLLILFIGELRLREVTSPWGPPGRKRKKTRFRVHSQACFTARRVPLSFHPHLPWGPHSLLAVTVVTEHTFLKAVQGQKTDMLEHIKGGHRALCQTPPPFSLEGKHEATKCKDRRPQLLRQEQGGPTANSFQV